MKASLGAMLRMRYMYVQHCYRFFLGFNIMNFQKLWREKANNYANEYLLIVTSYGADVSPEFLKTGHSLILAKSNSPLQASKAVSY